MTGRKIPPIIVEMLTVELSRQRNRENYQRHKEERIRKTSLRRDRWRKENPDAYKAEIKTYQSKPEIKDRIRIQKRVHNKRWAKDNPSKVNAKNKRYAHRKRSAVGTYTNVQWQARLAYYGWRCYLCRCDWFSLSEKDRTIDHVIPVSKGGTNWPSNLRPACRTCNAKKNDK